MFTPVTHTWVQRGIRSAKHKAELSCGVSEHHFATDARVTLFPVEYSSDCGINFELITRYLLHIPGMPIGEESSRTLKTITVYASKLIASENTEQANLGFSLYSLYRGAIVGDAATAVITRAYLMCAQKDFFKEILSIQDLHSSQIA